MLQRHLDRRRNGLRQHLGHRNIDLGRKRERTASIRARH